MKLKVPLAGNIFQNLAVARFCRVLGTLLHNGVPILRSLEIASSAAGNRILAAAYLRCEPAAKVVSWKMRWRASHNSPNNNKI